MAVNWLGIVLFPPDELMTVDGRTLESLPMKMFAFQLTSDYVSDPANHWTSFVVTTYKLGQY